MLLFGKSEKLVWTPLQFICPQKEEGTQRTIFHNQLAVFAVCSAKFDAKQTIIQSRIIGLEGEKGRGFIFQTKSSLSKTK